ncbi:MAG: purine-nucleoside phosphorylase [Rhodobacterales bacterium]|nr:purine-nucleoside phosphorylase [Rhodobacterales bacterium]
MHPEEPAVNAVVVRLRQTFGAPPTAAVVLGSGLGPVSDRLTDVVSADFEQLGIPGSTVPGHAGRVMVGMLGDTRTAIISGRLHLYEGHDPNVVVRYVRAMKAWGVSKLLLTCSVGGIASGLHPGTMVLITDHINMQHTNPLQGPAYGKRFPDMGQAYNPAMRKSLAEHASQLGLSLPTGILAAMPGPCYETPAEVRMLRTLGADVVGMSTVPEVIAAAAIDMDTAVVAVVSNRAAGLADAELTHDEVTETAKLVAHSLADLLSVAL